MNSRFTDYFVEVKKKRQIIPPTEILKTRKENLPKSMRTHYQVQKNLGIRKSQKVFRKHNDEILVKNCPKKTKTDIQQPKFKLPPFCPSCKRTIWLELDKVCYCQICEYFIINQKHRID